MSDEAPTTARVLLIDDETLLLRAMSRGLERYHRVVTAAGGREALRILADDQGFDAVICDMHMPDMSGEDVHDFLSANHAALARRFIVMTGNLEGDETREFLRRSGCVGLHKPFKLAELNTTLERLIRATSQP